jgi:hypothetical protein
MLAQLASEHEGFSYASLGALRQRLPLRTARLAHCRNHCLEVLRQRGGAAAYDYVVVADLDGVNSRLSQASVRSCWQRHDWDVCAANQDGPYYDIWALRHDPWCPGDCWEQMRFLRDHGLGTAAAIQAAVNARMIRIPLDAPWIAVDSAFGGLAIYRSTVLQEGVYVGLDSGGQEVCEHVSLHAQIRARGGRLFINPALINAARVEHAQALGGLGRLKAEARAQLRDLLQRLGLLAAAKTLTRP